MISLEKYDKPVRQYKEHCSQKHDFDIGGIKLDKEIIGGADGPTSVFITSGSEFYIIILIIALCIAIAVYLIHRKRKKKAGK